MIIDCHTHLNQYEDMKRLPLEDRLKLLLDNMVENHVDYSIALSSYKVNEDRPSTAQLIEATKHYNDKIGIVAGYSIDNHNIEYLYQCRQWLKDGVIKGMKLYCGYEHYYPSDPRYNHVYELCKEFDVPVMIHTGDTFSSKGKLKYSHPINIDEISVDNPELKIVMCHLGNPWIQDCQEVVYKNKNVYADISGLVLGDFGHFFEKLMTMKVMELLNYAGKPTYLMYGTDWPICNMDSYLNFVETLKLSREGKALLMYKNAKQVYKI
jgi:hypothetical protein